MTNDEVLMDFINKCPGLVVRKKRESGFFELMGDLIIEGAKELFDVDSDTYEHIYPNIPDAVQKVMSKKREQETIYYVAHRNVSTNLFAFVEVTSDNLYWTADGQGNRLYLPWDLIKNVNSAGNIEDIEGEIYNTFLAQIAKEDDDCRLNDKFVKWLNDIIKEIHRQHQQDREVCNNVDDINSVDELLAAFNQYEENRPNIANEQIKEEYFSDLLMKALDIYMDERNESEIDALTLEKHREQILDICETYILRYPKSESPLSLYLKGYVLTDCADINSMYEGIRCTRACMNLIDDPEAFNSTQVALRITAQRFAANFLSMPPKKRQFLVIDDSLSYLESNAIIVLPQELPETIHFPMGHPQEHVLYIKHPFIDDYYIPYETSEFELFKDKMDELRRVLQAMGATRITISDTKSLENSTNRKSHTNIDTNINAKINSLKGNADLTRDESSYESLLNEYGTESTYGPTKKPYIPDGLVWYPNESSWQRLFDERKDGLLHHKLRISSKSSSSLTKIQEQKLKADFKALILHIDASLEHEATETFEQNASATWELEIDFAPLEQLIDDSGNEEKPSVTTIPENTPSNNNCETADEAAYLEEVKFCLEDDGVIDEKERRILERIRIKYNINKSRAEELEKTLIQGTAEEEEFRNAVREYLEDGELTEKDNALLARLANRLGIAHERAEELKKQIIIKDE